eukprot:UN29715
MEGSTQFHCQLVSGKTDTGGRLYWIVAPAGLSDPSAEQIRQGNVGICGGYQPITDTLNHIWDLCTINDQHFYGLYTLWLSADIDGKGTSLQLVTPFGLDIVRNGIEYHYPVDNQVWGGLCYKGQTQKSGKSTGFLS